MAGKTTKAIAPVKRAASSGSSRVRSFPIVGVGASAGGLEAFTQLLKALPADTGMAFVLVQHLASTHSSSLAGILSRAARMPVEEAVHRRPVRPNHVYVIPPGTRMVLSAGLLHLGPRETTGQPRVIDHFFRSLAEDQGHRAIAVVLSGSATDGTLGLEEVKAAGGITFAQDGTALHDSMPHSAIAAGCVDFVLSPQKIATELARIARHPYVTRVAASKSDEQDGDLDRKGVLQLLRDATNVDLTYYKATTLDRRISRRMVLQKIEGLGEYSRFLRSNAGEVEALYQDILISVTSFFRDPETFAALGKSIFPKLLARRRRDEPLRAWVLGCSTGQEAYSLAIALTEFSETSRNPFQTQVFATDLNPVCIAKARAGRYPKDIARDITPERLQRFFVETDDGYRVAKKIRDQCVFAQHNVLNDPPFSHIDFISCRNVLIYLEPVLQHKVVPMLHYALNPGGFLMLGASETIGSARDLFEVVDAKHKFYARQPGPSRMPLGRVDARPRPNPGARAADHRFGPARGQNLEKEADRLLLTKYAPPGVLVSANLEILQFRGDTGPYLTPAPGKASLNLLSMARPGLLVPLRTTIHRAKKAGEAVRVEGVRVRSIGGHREVHVEVIPFNEPGTREGSGFLVLFEDAHRDAGSPPQVPPPSGDDAGTLQKDSEQQLAHVTQELVATREYLQSIIERFEATNEELQSANEETQSTNEELQSINEELETSKEEIQSGSEELATVNDELNNSNLELNQANNDLINLLDSVNVTIVMVDRDLRITRFTEMAARTLNLIAADVGRPISDNFPNVAIPDLAMLLAGVIEGGANEEREIQNKEGRWFALRLRPYRTSENKVDGAVMMLLDVDALERARAYAENIVETVRVPLVVVDADLRVRTANQAFYRTFEAAPKETEGQRLYDLGDAQWDIPKLRELMDSILSQNSTIENFEVEHAFEHIGTKVMLLSARQIAQTSDAGPLILLAIEDVTARKHGESERNEFLRQAQEARADAERANQAKDYFLATLSHELRTPLTTLLLQAHWLRREHEEDPKITAATEVIERAAKTQAQLIDDLLDVSRIAAGKLKLRVEPVDLGAIVQLTCDTMSVLAEKKSIHFAIELDKSVGSVMGDSIRLQQIVWNLLVNAIKFTPVGGGVGIRLRAAGDQTQVEVSDTGIGIEAEFLPRIFHRFEQLDNTNTREHGGLGLGLTIVHSLVELHGGTVHAASPGKNKGATFTVTLPLMRAKTGGLEDAPYQSSLRAGRLSSKLPDFQRFRILVVEDDPETREAVVAMLRKSNAEVRGAASAAEAMQVFVEFGPEAMVSDIAMPGEDGYSLVRRIRRLEPANGGQIPALALSALAAQEDRERALAAGFQMHMAKPFDFDQLADLLMGWTGSDRASVGFPEQVQRPR